MRRHNIVHPALQGMTAPAQPPAPAPAPAPPAPSPAPPVQNPTGRPVASASGSERRAGGDDSIRKFPRPLISQVASKDIAKHDAKVKYEEVPSALYEFIGKDEGNASCRFARSSISMVPENSGQLGKSGVPFSITLNMLPEPHAKDSPIPCGDKRETFVLRCERCGTFANNFFSYKDHWEKYVCNICELESSIDPKYLDKQTYSYEQFPETIASVCDTMVPNSYKLTEVKGNCILLCLDFSLEGLANGSFFHSLSSIRTSLDSLDEETLLGFCFWDSTVSLFRFDDELKDVYICRCTDPANPVAGLSTSDVFFNVRSQKSHIEKILQFFETFAEDQYANHASEMKNTPHCLEQLSLVIADLFSSQAGRAIIFASSHKKKPNEIVKYPINEKVSPFKAKVPFFSQVADTLAQRSVTVDLFIATDQQMELATIGELAQRTGGKIYYYPRFKVALHSEKYFYDLHRSLTVSRVFDVAVRLRCSSGFHVMDYVTPKGQVFSLDFTLPSLSSDQSIIANLQMLENIKDKKKVYFQAACLYTTSSGQRYIRTINFFLNTVPDMTTFFKMIDCDSLSYGVVQTFSSKLKGSMPADVQEDFMKAIEKLFRYYRFDVGGKYESKEFALPDKLKHFPLYICSFLHLPCLNPKALQDSDINHFSAIDYLQTPLVNFLYKIYPKLFDLSKLYEECLEDSANPGISGTKVDDVILLPDSIPATRQVIKQEGAYLADNGEYFFFYLPRQVPTDIVNELFGVQDMSEPDQTLILQNFEQSEFNQRVNNIIERLRAIKGGAVQPILVIREGDENVPKFVALLAEDYNCQFANSYWDFLTYLHDRVKDE